MERDLDETLRSQDKMLTRLGRAAAPREQIRQVYMLHLERLYAWLPLQGNMAVLRVGYNDLVERPGEQAGRVAAFIGGGLDVGRMANTVDLSLYRNRKAPGAARPA